jgi:hypothetical protein
MWRRHPAYEAALRAAFDEGREFERSYIQQIQTELRIVTDERERVRRREIRLELRAAFALIIDAVLERPDISDLAKAELLTFVGRWGLDCVDEIFGKA